MDDELRDHGVVEDSDICALKKALFHPHGWLDLPCGVSRDERCQLLTWVCQSAGDNGLGKDGRRCRRREVEQASRVWEEIIARVLGIYARFECMPDEGDGALSERQRVARCDLREE